MSLVFLKLFLFSCIVVTLSFVSKKLGSKYAGFLAAFPVTQAFNLLVFGLEKSPEFAAQSALYNTTNIFAASSLAAIYYLVSTRSRGLLAPILCSVVGFICVSLGIADLELPILLRVCIPLTGIGFLFYLSRTGEIVKSSKKSQSGPAQLIFKAMLSSSIVVIVLEIGKRTSPNLAGAFSSFPATLFPTMLIIHSQLGKDELKQFIGGIPIGHLSMIVYGLTVHLTYASLGVLVGTIMAYTCAILFLVTLNLSRKPLLLANKFLMQQKFFKGLGQ